MNPRSEAVREVIAHGRSMLPLIRERQRVGLAPISPEELRPGQIVAFEREGQTVLHRIIQLEQRPDGLWLREKGDNNRFSTWLPAREVTGRALWALDETQRIQLDPDPAGRRVRLLTALSRAEAWFGDRAARRGRGQGFTWRTPAFVLLTLPARLPALALLTAYRREEAAESDADRADLLALYRRLATGAGDLPACRPGLLRLAVAHGLDSLWGQLASGEPDLQRLRHRAGFQALSLRMVLQQTASALDRAGLPFVVLKGPPLAVRCYGDGAARAGYDIDVLVRRADRERAVEALLAAGYRCRSGKVAGQLIRRGHFHLVFDPPAKVNAAIELHWALVDRANLYRIDEEDAWAGARVVEGGGAAVRVLGPERELIYLCLHAAKHGFLNGAALAAGVPADWFARPAGGNRLIWMLDVLKLLEREAIDWAEVAAISRRWNCTEPVFQMLEILDQLGAGPRVAEGRAALRAAGGPRAEAGVAGGPGLDGLARWMRPHKALVIRPARLLELRALFFPGRVRLRDYYGDGAWWRVFTHPLHMARRLAGG